MNSVWNSFSSRKDVLLRNHSQSNQATTCLLMWLQLKISLFLLSFHISYLPICIIRIPVQTWPCLPPLTPANCCIWLPVPEPCSTRGYFLLKAVLPSYCHQMLVYRRPVSSSMKSWTALGPDMIHAG